MENSGIDDVLDQPDFSTLGGIVRTGLLKPPSKRSQKYAAQSRLAQIAFDPAISQQPVNKNVGHNFQSIQESIPGCPPKNVLIGAWSRYQEAVRPSQSDQNPNSQHRTEHHSDQQVIPYLSAIESVEETLDDTRDSRELQRSHDPPCDAGPELKASPSIPLLKRRPRQRQLVASRYQYAAENTEVLNLKQNQLAEEREHGWSLNGRLAKKKERLEKRRDRLHDLQQKKRERKTRDQHDPVSETIRNRPEQKRKLDELFAQAGYS